MGEEDRWTAKEEQERGKGCATLWCRSKSRWYPGREWKKERRRKHTQGPCLCVCGATEGGRPVKRKGSDQRRDEAMEEARGETRGRVGGTVRDTRPVRTEQPYCFVHNLYGNVLLSWSLPSLCLEDACAHTPTHNSNNKLSPPFIWALHLPDRKCSTAIKDVVTLRLTASSCYPDHRNAMLKKKVN